jgi:hypothetical protein
VSVGLQRVRDDAEALRRGAADKGEDPSLVDRAVELDERRRALVAEADSLKAAFNAVLWKEDLPGGPRYLDWIDTHGQPVAYFCDLCQWPPIAFGIASPEQSRKIVATADVRMAQLEKEHGYQGFAGLSALWPIRGGSMPFKIYQNGGMLLAQTFWEIMGRARAGDAEGAARRLRLFAKRASQTSWVGQNSFDMDAAISRIESGEPYLADMVVTSASVVHGLLGITPTWERLEVTPHLPADWPKAAADVLYKGRRHHIAIDNGKVQVKPLEQVIDLPLLWTMDFNLQSTPRGIAKVSNVDFGEPYNNSFFLKKSAASGTYQSPPHDWAVLAKLAELKVAVDLQGGQATATVETSNDAFNTVSSSGPIPLRDGVNTYSLGSIATSARNVRLRFNLGRGPDAAPAPVIDAYQLLAAQQQEAK